MISKEVLTIVDINNFSYERRYTKIHAYDRDFELPVRTGAFCDKQDEIDRRIADMSKPRSTGEIIDLIKEGIALYIGAEETERIFPNENRDGIDVDEITVFYKFLKDVSLRNLAEYSKKYAPSGLRK